MRLCLEKGLVLGVMSEFMLENYKYISFDIFDTLVKRCVTNPPDVFDLIDRYCKKNEIPVPDDFKDKRITAERMVNQKNKRPSTIGEIYDFFCQEYGGNPAKLEEIEKLVELNVCKPNTEIINLYHKCIEAGKKVYVISDMYLDAAFLKKILSNCGIEGYEKIFVSCEYHETKTTGELFKKVIEEKGLEPERWLHIGDNSKGDVGSPKKLGISTYHVPYEKPQVYPVKATIREKLDFEIANRNVSILAHTLNTSKAMGAKVLGPLLAGFSKWLSVQLKQRDIFKVFFLSRDGYSMKKAFDLINPSGFETAYIYASRRSWTVPAIWMEPEYEDILKNISMSPKTSVKSFLTRIGLEADKYGQEVKQCGLTLETTINKKDLLDSDKFRQIYSMVRERVIENSRKEYNAVVQYLQENNVCGKIAIVDIGYNRTMQKALQRILEAAKINADVVGFYMGLNPKSKLIESHEIDTLSFLYGPELKNDYQDKINAFISVFESIFLSQHGSTHRFCLENNVPVVEFYDYEYDLQESKYIDEVEIIKDFQQGAMDYVEFVATMLNNELLVIDNSIAINNLLYMGLKPEKSGVDLFSDFRMFDTRISHIAHPDTLMHYLRNPSRFKRDFTESTWKIAFLYRLFKLPIPYEKIYYILKSFVKS